VTGGQVAPGLGTFTAARTACTPLTPVGDISIKKQKRGRISGFVEDLDDFAKTRPEIYFSLLAVENTPEGPVQLQSDFERAKSGKVSKRGKVKFSIGRLKKVEADEFIVFGLLENDDGAAFTPLLREDYEAGPK
jgi:hypothetical protein